jgi:hypothetical protein
VSKKIATNLDLLLNELQNFRFQQLSTNPSSPVEGQAWENTTLHHFYMYLNGIIVQLDAQIHGITDLTSDVTASGVGSVAATVAFVGGASAANVADASTKRHTQNTDTGTTNPSFQIDSGNTGSRLKMSGGTLSVRNAADSADADLQVRNLFVSGEMNEVSSTTINLQDNILNLNNDNALNSTNADGGITVKRLDTDNTTRRDASLEFIESTKKWTAGQPNSAGVIASAAVARKVVADVGDGAATSYVITHGLNTRDVVCSIHLKVSTYDYYEAEIQATTLDSITVIFAAAPTTNQFTVTIIG